MTRRTTLTLMLGLAAAGLAAGALILTANRANAPAEAQAVYYCPMHPSYTSDRPGDCPICNMRLVRREPEAGVTAGDASPTAGAPPFGGATSRRQMPADAHAGHDDPASQAGSICILHNCPELHEGRPCPMTVVGVPGERVVCPICGTYLVREDGTLSRLLYWTDPAIPGFQADGPGVSPAGAALVPVYEEANPTVQTGAAPEGYAPVLLTAKKQQLIGVKSEPVIRRPLTKTIRTVGRIAYDPELYQAQEEYLQARRAQERASAGGVPDVLDQARRLVESSRMRLRLMGLSDELILELEARGEPDTRLLLAAPEGAAWLYASIYEYELPVVSVGQQVQVALPARPGTVLTGMIRGIDPVLDPATRSARVRAVIEDQEGVLKPQMYVDVSIVIPLGEVLAVPREAVLNTGTKQIVFVDRGQGLLEPRDVVVGASADRHIEITRGVAEGERVITRGNFLIDSESRLKAALEGVGTGAGHQHGQ
ncbi:MAG TPA: efflux RND transporter periplasmic adaptor subunit [bacterium]